MKKGISLHIGLNYVDPNHYSGWDGKLNAAEFDANDMELILGDKGFGTNKLLREQATRDNVVTFLEDASKNLGKDDILVVSYSGHGGQIPDHNNDEDDGLDETWCLYDGQLVDDELSALWSNFAAGARILVISDSCHSGSVVKYSREILHADEVFGAKYMPYDVSSTTYFNNKAFYDGIQSTAKAGLSKSIAASVKLISGCQDNQSSYDGAYNGVFTGALKRIWNGGKFQGDYWNFYKRIMNLLPENQTPNYFDTGVQNRVFDSERPFSI